MKKAIANICIWILKRIGYENNYSRKNEIIVSVDTKEALNRICELAKATKKLSNELRGIKEIQTDIHGL